MWPAVSPHLDLSKTAPQPRAGDNSAQSRCGARGWVLTASARTPCLKLSNSNGRTGYREKRKKKEEHGTLLEK